MRQFSPDTSLFPCEQYDKTEGSGGEGGILPLVQQEIPVMMVKPNLRVCNGTEVL
jgi:hypothetical protein